MEGIDSARLLCRFYLSLMVTVRFSVELSVTFAVTVKVTVIIFVTSKKVFSPLTKIRTV